MGAELYYPLEAFLYCTALYYVYHTYSWQLGQFLSRLSDELEVGGKERPDGGRTQTVLVLNKVDRVKQKVRSAGL
jgi:hypothetical protein